MTDQEGHGRQQAVDVTTKERDDDDFDVKAYIAEYGKPYLFKHLMRFGFTQHMAHTICQSIPDELIGLQTPAYWANRYINSLPIED
jgi:hypothetical protein